MKRARISRPDECAAGVGREARPITVFGWQGFRFEHPASWAPVTLGGDRRSGYVRLVSSGSVGCQVRWQRSGSPAGLETKLEAYFARLRADAKRAHRAFEGRIESRVPHLTYSWRGVGAGRGALLWRPECRRVFFIEASGERGDSLQGLLKAILGSFASGEERGKELWSLMGLSVVLPAGLLLESVSLRSGNTRLRWRGRWEKVTAERWAFGAQLIAKHGFEEWARAALGLRKAEARAHEDTLRFSAKSTLLPFRRIAAIAKLEREKNQITLVRVDGFRGATVPDLDWIV